MSESPQPGHEGLPRRRGPKAGAFVPGTMLADRYRIVARVGRGGMGEVYRADDLRLGQPVALKFLPPELEHDDEARERLLGEVRLARTIAHPNVCRVYDIGDLPAEGGVPARTFLTMEYIDGEDLATLLRRIGRLPPAKALDIARQLCAGLAAAHDKGVLHRDLKPANVMIDGRGHARIADFGIAVVSVPDADADDTDSGSSSDGAGTLAYMAPERFAGDPATVRSDLYALGLILYETVTGTSAFRVSSAREWQAAHMLSAPSNPSEHVSDVDPAVERAILRCLEKDPAKRPASAAQVAAALPGGDPLAAAIAAGETPSPELVAASGEDGTLPRGKAFALFATAVVTLAIAVALVAPTLEINRTPLPLDTGDLERRSREILVSLGYTAPPEDWASQWVRYRTGLGFNYRQSPGEMFQAVGGVFGLRPNYREEATLSLRPDGHLNNLDVGGAFDYSDTTGVRTTDWSPLLAAIGADAPPVPSATRRWPPAYYADTRAAWTAVIAGVPSEIEAASLRGRAMSLRIRKLGAPDENPAQRRGAANAAAGVGVFILILTTCVLALLARRNIRLGRGDRRGATRMAVVAGLLFWVNFATNRHWNLDAPDLLGGGLLSSFSFPLVQATMLWLLYVGVEPYVRRRWPSLLVAWTRLLDGRLRDGLVGQALLGGVVAGLVGTCIGALWRYRSGAELVYDGRWILPADSFNQIGGGILLGLVAVALLVLARLLLRRDWAAWCALGLVIAIPLVINNAAGGVGALLVNAALPIAAVLLVLRRFGLLTLMVMIAVVGGLTGAPLTLDPSRWYFWRGAFAVAIVLALAVWGFINVMGKQSLVPSEALDA